MTVSLPNLWRRLQHSLSRNRVSRALEHPARTSYAASSGPRCARSLERPALPSRIAAGFNLRNIGHTLLQPRLAMTAAMAFFSVALTLNLTGIRITDLRARDLRPSNIKRTFSEANAHVVRYYDNLRVVYELESRVRDLQRSADSEEVTPIPATTPTNSTTPPAAPSGDHQPSAQPDQQDHGKQPSPRPTPGTSSRDNPGSNLRYVVADNQRTLFSVTPYLPQSLDASLPSLQLHRPAGPTQEERLA